MRKSTRILLVAVTMLMALLFLVGCEELKAKVESAQNPAPVGEYLELEDVSVNSLNEKANYAWPIGGVERDAVTKPETEYFVNMEPVSYDLYWDARSNEGIYEGDNKFADDTYDILVEPAGVIALVNVNMGE